MIESQVWVLVSSLTVLSGGKPPLSVPEAAAADTMCVIQFPDRLPAEGRVSPLDSISFKLGGHTVKICYGRPSARGRTMIGGEAVPYDHLWRTGANEATMIHATGGVNIAGIQVPAGSYSLYTVPGETEWEVIVNRSTSQWGREDRYTDEVRAQEVARARVRSEHVPEHIETFTMRAEPQSSAGFELVLEWEHTRVRIPVVEYARS